MVIQIVDGMGRVVAEPVRVDREVSEGERIFIGQRKFVVRRIVHTEASHVPGCGPRLTRVVEVLPDNEPDRAPLVFQPRRQATSLSRAF